MKTKDRDVQSYLAIINSFIDLAHLDLKEAEIIKKELKTYLLEKFEKKKWVHPEITKFCTDWYREFYRLIGSRDPYWELKQNSNEISRQITSSLEINNLKKAIASGIFGNKLDYGAVLVHQCNLDQLNEEFLKLNQFNNFSFDFDDTSILIERIEKLTADKKVLFLTDNCGEIFFDTFLLEEIKKKVGKENLWIMAKESPMLNDATVEDLQKNGLGKYGQIFSTGSNCFGLHREDVSEECRRLLREADLIIAKGQAYLEFFTEYNFPNVINILLVKYPIINPALGTLPSGCKAVISSERYALFGKDYFS